MSDWSHELELLERLAVVVGDTREAAQFLSTALKASGRKEVPRDPAQICSFARAHLVEMIAAAVGPRTAMIFLEDLREHFGKGRPATPASITRTSQSLQAASDVHVRSDEIVIIDDDRFARATIARLLIQSGKQVVSYDGFDDIVLASSCRVVVAAIRSRARLLPFARLAGDCAGRPLVVVAGVAIADVEVAARASSGPVDVLPAASPAASVATVVLACLESPRAEAR